MPNETNCLPQETMPDMQNMQSGQNNAISDGMQMNEYSQRQTNSVMQRPDSTTNQQDQDTYGEILAANVGAYVLIQFLVGSTSLVDKEGYLYAVGVNFVTIYEPLDDRYVVCDLYSVKFVSIFNSPPIGNAVRTNNAMSYSSTQNNRYMRNYTQNSRRPY